MAVLYMPKYEVFTFKWGSAVKDRSGKWIKIFIAPLGQEIDVSDLQIELHENGIEFLL